MAAKNAEAIVAIARRKYPDKKLLRIPVNIAVKDIHISTLTIQGRFHAHFKKSFTGQKYIELET